MVYFRKEMRRAILVHPQYLGPALKQYIHEQLVSEVEGMSVDNAGFIITVLSIEEDKHPRGMIDHLTGFVKYSIGYSALMFRPFKNEVLDATVKAVSDVGFFAEAGPLSIFVSRVYIPQDLEYNAEVMAYASTASPSRITAEAKVRLKIIGSSVQATTLCAIGSMAEPYLGVLE